MREIIQGLTLRILFAVFVLMALAAIGGLGNANAQTMSDCAIPLDYHHREGKIGHHLTFVCATKDRSVVFPYSYYCKKSEPGCGLDAFFKKFGPALWAKDPRAAIDAQRLITFDCKAPTDQYKDLCAEYKAILAEEWGTWTKDFTPIKYTYKVKPNPACDPTKPPCTRPGYPLVNGVVGTAVAKDSTGKEVRAPVGALCRMDTATAPASGTDIRAQWADGPAGVVTICSKGAQ